MTNNKLKIVAISDTHTKHREITDDLPDGDVIIHAGDMTSMGYFTEIKDFLAWFNDLSYKYKILIAGNHDWGVQLYPKHFRNILKDDYPNIIYLENESVVIEGVKIWGSPYTPKFYDWAFNVKRGELDVHWNLIPKDTDIIVTHGPANGYGDKVPPNPTYNIGTHCGCEQLLARIKKVKPKFHIFGHIHSCSGIIKTKYTTFVNAAVLDEAYRYNNPPRVIEIKIKKHDK